MYKTFKMLSFCVDNEQCRKVILATYDSGPIVSFTYRRQLHSIHTHAAHTRTYECFFIVLVCVCVCVRERECACGWGL